MKKRTAKRSKKRRAKKSHKGQAMLPFARAAKARRGCGCNGRCCAAAGKVCSCRCHGRHHGERVVYRNPPSRPLPKIKVGVIGHVESITYRRGGKRWRHHVEGKAQLCAPKSGSYVVINGIRVSRFLEG